MSTSSQFETDSNEGFLRSMFTNPLARNFQAWVSIVNFWIFISCLTLAGETVEPITDCP